MKRLLIAAALALVCAAPASAAVVFNLGAGSNTENTIPLSQGGLDVVVTGHSGFALLGGFPGGAPNGALTNINRNNLGNGWGVNGGGSGLIDVGDALHFDFSPTSVSLLKTIIFELDGTSDEVAIFADGVLAQTVSLAADPGADSFMFDLSAFSVEGTTFTFATTVGATRVQSIEVEASTTPVPLPASGLLIVAGVAGLTVLRRRNTA